MNREQAIGECANQALLDEIPAGVQQCRNEPPDYPMVALNQGFLDLFGYTREEIAGRFHNSYTAMIHPSDRAAVSEQVEERLNRGEKIAFSYRVLCRDGGYKWVKDSAHLLHDADGNEWIFCVVLDDTKSRNDREELRLSLERHQIILNQTTDIIFEWDILDDTMTYSTNWVKKFGYDPIQSSFIREIPLHAHVHPDDMPLFLAIVADAQSGKAYSTAEFRIQNAQGRYLWCRVRATDQYDGTGRPIKTVGVITDIDKERKVLDDLRQRAERDALTGLLNREETERQIRAHLEGRPEALCALMMIDTDNFKGVNDSQGHLFGDAVLSELAAGMKKLTRQSDVVGRIGGDEFAIFLKDIPSREMAAKKAAQLLELFQGLFQEGKRPIEVTCSAGVAVYPDDGADFQALYHCADIALYQAKSGGKNQYRLFSRESVSSVGQTGYSALGAAIDSDLRTEGMPENLVSYVFQILFDASDIDHAIQMILEIVGKQFDVSRAYIFENTDDGLYADNTYEWCNEGIVPQKEHLQHFPYAEAEGYRELFRDNAIFYCRDIHSLPPALAALFEKQNIFSVLQCAILEDDTFGGFVGFDECTGMRMWTKEEIGTLSLISQLLTTFLQKKRATDRDRELAFQLNTILDTQDAYIYAIEQDSCKLLYLNHKTRELDPSVKPGMTCYGAFFGLEEPCETCPLSGAGEIYNPKYDLWNKVRVAPMKWGAIDSYLLSYFDITEYKRMQKPRE